MLSTYSVTGYFARNSNFHWLYIIYSNSFVIYVSYHLFTSNSSLNWSSSKNKTPNLIAVSHTHEYTTTRALNKSCFAYYHEMKVYESGLKYYHLQIKGNPRLF